MTRILLATAALMLALSPVAEAASKARRAAAETESTTADQLNAQSLARAQQGRDALGAGGSSDMGAGSSLGYQGGGGSAYQGNTGSSMGGYQGGAMGGATPGTATRPMR